ncbi:MAG: hypothetical protein IJT14_00755 [Rickettsiales bacterium]|nr:hypothetical protein [Rickettsiales bacterium]
MESSNKKNIEEKQIKIYVEKGSPLYEKIKKLAENYPLDNKAAEKYNLPYGSKGNIIQFIEGYKNARLLVADKEIMPIGKIDVEKVGNEERIYIEWPEDKAEEKINITFFHKVDVQNNAGYYWLNQSVIGDSKYEHLLEGVSVAELQQAAQAQNANINIHNMPKTCKISCRTAPGKQPSIRVQFPDDNKVTFYQDGWCNGKNNEMINIYQNRPIKTTDEYTIYNVGQGEDKVEISYRHTGNKSIRITNKNGDGICIYPDLYVNPVKNGHMTKQGSKKINCNLFEFIENNFFKVNYNKNKSVLKKPIQNASHNVPQQYQFQSGINNPFNNQPSNIIQNAPNNSMLYSLNETNEFTINL